jgi:threonine dehydrogenase-like Zn-dependent dehydrogenase
MRSVLIDAPRQISVGSRPEPTLPGPNGAIVEVTASAICGSDLHFYEGDYPLVEPVALGHEAVGTVVETGPEVHTLQVGGPVLVSSVAGCGACIGCATADPITCLSGPAN